MPWPASVITRIVSFGQATILESGEDLSLRTVTTASRSLISQSHGYRLESRSVSYETSGAGEEVAFPLPVTDQAGWLDAETREVLDVSGDRHSHLYTTTLTVFVGSTQVATYTIGPYPVPQGAGPLDTDTMLVPDETQDGILVAIPEAWANIIADANALVALRGQPDGLAPLDGLGKVPDENLPERLSEVELPNTINSQVNEYLNANPPSGGIPPSLVDAKGDLIVGTANDAVTRVPRGADGQVLTADSADAAGVKWVTPTGGGATGSTGWNEMTVPPETVGTATIWWRLRRDGNIVHCIGNVQGTPAGTALGSIPVGYRPSASLPDSISWPVARVGTTSIVNNFRINSKTQAAILAQSTIGGVWMASWPTDDPMP